MAEILTAPLEVFNIPQEVLNTYQPKNLEFISYTMSRHGQQMPVAATELDGKLVILDGYARFLVCKALNIPMLKYIIVDDVPDGNIIQKRMILNQRTKKSIIEICKEAEYALEFIGSCQGKKRKKQGLENLITDEEFERVGNKRYELVCALIGIEISGSTLRKLMEVFKSDYKDNKSETGTLNLLNDGKISIDKAYQLLKNKEKKEAKFISRNPLRMVHSIINDLEPSYKLFNKSSLFMDNIDDDSIDLSIDSHPYALGQRTYRNQDEMLHGQEDSVEEYLQNFKAFNQEKFRVLKKGGLAATMIGESYKEGYQCVCSRAELVLQEIGFKILDVIIWVKTNQKYTPHPNRFQNTYERIIVAYKPGAEPFFQEVYRQSSVKRYKAKKTSSGGYYMAGPETCITNVITTPVFNPSVFKEIDPDFKHDAPCPTELYEILIEAYSKPGDTILDGFVGSGTVGIGLQMGRKVIGYDVDPISIDFARKRFEWFLQQKDNLDDQNNLSIAA